MPAFNATAWAKLSAAGAVLIGKTQMGPLATTAATTPEGEATTVNAWAPLDRRRVSPGGSSSGSATAVAGRLAVSATGTQTGGSITGPSAAQGLTGIKPTLGRVSLHGIIPLTYTRDHVGPLARDARDAAVMLQAMAGPDSEDPRSLGLPPVPDYVAAVGPTGTPDRPRLAEGARIGVLPGYLSESSDSGAQQQQEQEPPFAPEGASERAGRPRERRAARIEARRRMLQELEGLGARPVEIDLPPAWEELTSRELNNVRLPERSEIFLEELRRDVRNFGVSLSPWINGLLLPAAEYVRGQRARLLLLRSILDDIFSRCDAVVQTEPFPFDMVGLPLISFPIGFEEPEGAVRRPIGALLGGPPYEEGLLLSLAAAYQGVTDWHRRRPPDPDAFQALEAEGSSGRGRGTTPRYDLFDVMERGE